MIVGCCGVVSDGGRTVTDSSQGVISGMFVLSGGINVIGYIISYDWLHLDRVHRDHSAFTIPELTPPDLFGDGDDTLMRESDIIRLGIEKLLE
ncbi:unnamed protein product [Pieris macdunnoughi]|uniref:Uncharacterized protein n=1 Tax=Pieris macdunnoughi TaxID=345717 RepID=A0A821VT60_9NEOP|nr:unnamed protein product [Pieris macdunnoughi]